MRQILSFDVGLRNLAYCLIRDDAVNGPVVVRQWDNVDIMGKTNAQTLSKLIDLLDVIRYDIVDDDVPLHVLVENQPSRARNLMKVIQTYIDAYFRVVSKYDNKLNVVTHTISPRGKLRIAPACQNEQQTCGKSKTSRRNAAYNQNKRRAIDAVTRLIADPTRVSVSADLHAKFECAKKKDDLADCLMQSLFFVGRSLPL